MGYWIGDESDPWNPDQGSGNARDEPLDVHIGRRILDVPADAINATTGTGENTGWFGEFDQQADPRSWNGEEPDWAEPSEQTNGISGFFGAATGATGHVVDEASSGAGNALLQTPKFLALLVVAALMMLAPYASMATNLTEG
jgi:hypothetical protein